MNNAARWISRWKDATASDQSLPGRRILATGAALLLLLLVALPAFAGTYALHMVILTLLAIILAVSYRLLLRAGEASFCHGAFYGLGGYTVAILTTKAGFSFWTALPLGGAVAAIAAFIIGLPALRTKGPYFFLMTFGFLVITNSLFANLTGLTGGYAGIAHIPAPAGISSVGAFFYLSLALCVLTVAVFFLFDRSAWGLRLRAIGASGDLAQAVGINRLKNMLWAFAVGAFFAGVGGGFYASYIAFISPNSFDIWLSVYVLIYVMIGGPTHIVGAIVGAAYLTLIPVAFNWSQNLIGIFAAASIVVVMMALPRGIIGQILSLQDRGKAKTPATSLCTAHHRNPAPIAPRQSMKSARPILTVEGLDHAFGGIHVTRNVSFEIAQGETIGIIGPNGAGKTTLLNLITGFIRPRTGRVHLDGTQLVGRIPTEIVHLGLARTFQASLVFEQLTVEENVLLAARGAAASRRQAALPEQEVQETLELVGLASLAKAKAADLPYGLKKILGLAIALPLYPKVLCLDEPFTGLNLVEAREIVGVLHQVQAARNLAIILVEHRVPILMELCDRLVVLNFGEIIATGRPEDIRRDPEVEKIYFGTGAH